MDRFLLTIVTLSCAGLAFAHPRPPNADGFAFPKSNDEAKTTPKLNKELIVKCLDLGNFMPAINASSGVYECFALATQGPCKNDEWFIIKENSLEAECVKRKCDTTREVFYVDKCFAVGSVSLCPTGMELLPNSHGEGECECKFGFLPWENKTGDITCYQSFLQGPCPDGQQIANEDEKAVCKSSDCPINQIRWKNEECIDKISCDEEDYDITFDEEGNNFVCASDVVTRTLLVVPTSCDDGLSLNNDGECVGTGDDGRRRSPRLANSKDFKRLLKNRL